MDNLEEVDKFLEKYNLPKLSQKEIENLKISNLFIPEYSGINNNQRIHDRSKTAHRTPPVKCFLTLYVILFKISIDF